RRLRICQSLVPDRIVIVVRIHHCEFRNGNADKVRRCPGLVRLSHVTAERKSGSHTHDEQVTRSQYDGRLGGRSSERWCLQQAEIGRGWLLAQPVGSEVCGVRAKVFDLYELVPRRWREYFVDDDALVDAPDGAGQQQEEESRTKQNVTRTESVGH